MREGEEKRGVRDEDIVAIFITVKLTKPINWHCDAEGMTWWNI